MKKYIFAAGAAILLILIAGYFKSHGFKKAEFNLDTDSGEEAQVPVPTPASPEEVAALPNDTTALGSLDVLIADRGNNRLLIVTPDKKIIWQYKFDLPKAGLGADDAFFTDGGKSIIVNLEEYQLIEVIDIKTKQVTWSYGYGGHPGSADGYLNTPDDAYKLPNGDITVADIKNCRILEISPDKKIVRQYGKTRECKNESGFLNKPNGDTPIAGGHTFVSNIVGKQLIELDQNWQPVFSMILPVNYPSDPQLTQAGNILISDYSTPGQIVEVSKSGEIIWRYEGSGAVRLNKPSLAIELANGDILSNDDLNHRVILIDKKTKQIVWQYGVTGKPGSAAGQLSVPDGLDTIPDSTVQLYISSTTQAINVATIGKMTRDPAAYFGKTITVSGYLLKQTSSYAIFSDEASGAISKYDLPVIGPGIQNFIANKKYQLTGTFIQGGLNLPTGNAYHLELNSAD